MRYHLEADSSHLFSFPALIFAKLISAGQKHVHFPYT
jgi:hypothetical protein